MICGNNEKNGCVMLVKRFIDIPPYLKWDRGAAFHRCNGYNCTVIVGSPEYAPEWWRYPETIE